MPSSAQMNYSSQSHAPGSIGQMVVGQASNNNNNNTNDKQKQLYEVDTEKLLLSNDKVTINDLWKSSP